MNKEQIQDMLCELTKNEKFDMISEWKKTDKSFEEFIIYEFNNMEIEQ